MRKVLLFLFIIKCSTPIKSNQDLSTQKDGTKVEKTNKPILDTIDNELQRTKYNPMSR